jgi:hypothetical protein
MQTRHQSREMPKAQLLCVSCNCPLLVRCSSSVAWLPRWAILQNTSLTRSWLLLHADRDSDRSLERCLLRDQRCPIDFLRRRAEAKREAQEG